MKTVALVALLVTTHSLPALEIFALSEDPLAEKHELPTLKCVPADVAAVVSDADFTSYSLNEHTFTLKPEAAGRLRTVANKWLGFCVDRKPIYFAKLWKTIYSETATHAVVIESSPGVFAVELGYPTEEYFVGTDPQDNLKLVESVLKARIPGRVASSGGQKQPNKEPVKSR